MLVQQVWRYLQVVPGVDRRFEFLFGPRPDTGFTHDSGDTVFTASHAIIDKIPVNLG